MNSLTKIVSRSSSFILVIILLSHYSCSTDPSIENNGDQITAEESIPLLNSLEVFADTNCTKTFENILRDQETLQFSTYQIKDNPSRLSSKGCNWTRLSFINPSHKTQLKFLYFPKGWQNLKCFISNDDVNFEAQTIGIKEKKEYLNLIVPPMDTVVLYVKYPTNSQAYNPIHSVIEMSESEFQKEHNRTNYKFFFIGLILFPILFFLAEYVVQRDKLSLYLLLFLTGSALNLITILDTISYFQLSPKIVASARVSQSIFLLSTILLLFGLMKYVFVFLDLGTISKRKVVIGHYLFGLLLCVGLVPLIFSSLLFVENYGYYLQYFRFSALFIFLYILIICIWAVTKKINFSRILLGAFMPFIICAIYYATSFIIIHGFSYPNTESFILIFGFLLTLILFGVVLGLRNNAIKRDRIVLEQRADHLRELDEFKSRFYTNITHEIRTPLTIIKGNASQLISNNKIKKQILHYCDRLLYLVNQLLDLSKLQNNRLTIDWKQGDVIPFLRYLSEAHHSVAVNKNINLAFFSNEEEFIMDYDEKIIQQILSNLIINAIKFTPQYGSVLVSAVKRTDVNSSYLELKIKDTGEGISEKNIPQIFDRFYQVDDSNTKKEYGFGIGLSFVRELVQLISGSIKVQSTLGRGSIFEILIPVHNEAEFQTSSDQKIPIEIFLDQKTEIDPSLLVGTQAKKNAPLVLIIEDNIDAIEYIISCLKDDYRILAAKNGSQGVKEAVKNCPDIIICDVMMPILDGYQVCKQLKSDSRTSHIPIILLTAKSTQEDKIEGLSHGANAFLTKPFDKDELLVRLSNMSELNKNLRDRYAHIHDIENEELAKDDLEASFILKVKKIIESHISDSDFDTLRLSRQIAMSRTQLHRKLKALTGLPTATFIRSIRLQKAKDLLENTMLPIGEIALEVGYQDFSHFSRSFSKEFHLKPSETRK